MFVQPAAPGTGWKPDTTAMHDDSARRHAPATERNRDPILAVLHRVLPPAGTVLEIASGTGEHAIHFAPRLHPRHWQPSDTAPAALASIAAWLARHPADNLLPPITLDATDPGWPQRLAGTRPAITAIVCINLIHIAPWSACLGLLAGAGRLLPAAGRLVLYGPFRRHGEHTAPGNAAFDHSLRARNPAWGVRNLETVAAAAREAGLVLIEVVPMPANNLIAVFAPASPAA